MKKFTALVVSVLSGFVFAAESAQAQTIDGTVVTVEQNLTATGTLTVTATGTLNVGGGNPAVQFNASGNGFTMTVNNSGTIEQSGTTAASTNGNAINDNKGHTTIIINNNASGTITAVDDDAIHLSSGTNNVTINNHGIIYAQNVSDTGSQAIDLNKITSGANSIYNYAGATVLANDSDSVRPGVNGFVYNSGTIKSTQANGNGSDGIDAQSNSGITITNDYIGTTGDGAANLIEGGRHGITGGQKDASTAFTMTITNNANGTIQGDNGSGINIDGFNALEQVTINNSGTITGIGSVLTTSGDVTEASQDGDGIDVDGVAHITNSGRIQSLNAIGDTSEGITIGGGSVLNLAGGVIEGSVTTSSGSLSGAVGRGITLAGLDKDANGNPIPIQQIYADTTVTNYGLIKGDTDSGIAILGQVSTSGTFSVTITNSLGGIIEGGGATAAAIEAGTVSNPITITNWGAIEADASGKAIDFGSGTNSLVIKGGCASIIGDIDGGTGTTTVTIDPSAHHTFSYDGVISNVANVTIQSGNVIFSGNNTYTGETDVTGGRFQDDGSVAGNVNVSSGAEVGGHGKIGGTISGAGSVGPGNSPGILTAAAVDPSEHMSYNLEFSRSGEAIWSNASASGNDVLHLEGATPFTQALGSTNDLNLYFAAAGATYIGGFFVDGATDNLTANIADATFNYYLLDDANGTVCYNGHDYDVLSADLVTVSTLELNDVTFGDESNVDGWTEEFTVAVPEPSAGYALLGVAAILGLLAIRRRTLA